MFDTYTPREKLNIMAGWGPEWKEELIVKFGGYDEPTLRRLRSGRRPIGPRLGERISLRFTRGVEEKFGIPGASWGKLFDGVLERVRAVSSLPTVELRKEAITSLLSDDLMLATMYHPCSDESDNVDDLIARAGQNVASCLLWFCWAPHEPNPELRAEAPHIAIARGATGIKLLERGLVVAEEAGDIRLLKILKQLLAQAHINHLAMYSEFRADRINSNGGFSTFSDADVMRIMNGTHCQTIYDVFCLIPPSHPGKRILSQSMLSIAARCEARDWVGEAWQALIDEWPAARELRNPNSGVDRSLADDSDMGWIIKTFGSQFDETKFPNLTKKDRQ